MQTATIRMVASDASARLGTVMLVTLTVQVYIYEWNFLCQYIGIVQ